MAYDGKVAGIRMLDQPYMTDLIEVDLFCFWNSLLNEYILLTLGQLDGSRAEQDPHLLGLVGTN